MVNEHDLRSRLKLYLVMGSVNCAKRPAEVLKEAIRGGVTMFQYREKGPGALRGEKKYELGAELRNLCRQSGVPFIVNDDVELALRLDADGIHIGQEDAPVEAVRRRIGNKILGVSAHNPEEARAALEQGADYLGVGPMYPTATKPDAREVWGPSVIRTIRQGGVVAPLVGIGGISPGRALPVIEAGADGVAVISAISAAADIAGTARQIRIEIKH